MKDRKTLVSRNPLSLTLALSMTLALSACSDDVEVAATPEERAAIVERIKPVISLGDMTKPAAAAPTAAPAEAAAAVQPEAVAETETAPSESAPPLADAAAAKPLYDKACMACHTTGAAGAPMLGDKVAWEPRLSAAGGVDGLVASARTGKGVMPPNGGSTYSEDEMRQVIEFILAEAGLI